MAEISKKLNIQKNNIIEQAKIYNSLNDLASGKPYLKIQVDNQNCYVALDSVGSENGTSMRVNKNGTVYQVQKESITIDMSTYIVLSVLIPNISDVCKMTTLNIIGNKYTVNWGDNTQVTYSGETKGHIYANPGTYTITITGHVTSLLGKLRQGVDANGEQIRDWGAAMYTARTNIYSVQYLNSSTITEISFNISPDLLSINMNNVNLPNLIKLNEGFNWCAKYDVSKFAFNKFPKLLEAQSLLTDNKNSIYYDWAVRKNILQTLPRSMNTLQGMFEDTRDAKTKFKTWQAAYADIEPILNTFPVLTDKNKILNRWGNERW